MIRNCISSYTNLGFACSDMPFNETVINAKNYTNVVTGQNVTQEIKEAMICFINGTKVENVTNTMECDAIPLGTEVTYTCKDNHRLMNNTELKEEADNTITISCSEEGEYSLDNSTDWAPVCVQQTECPSPPIRVDLRNDDLGFDNFYGKNITYRCENRSMFDMDDDGVGETQK